MNSEFDDNRPHDVTEADSEAADTRAEAGNPETEADVLRSELISTQEKLEVLQQTSDDYHDKFMRSRAELDNYRRRSAADMERARASGLDSALATVLRVFDDLERALQVSADGHGSAIIDGVRLVLENLEGDLERLGVTRLGAPGEQFDPELHEALTALPADEEHASGTIAQVVKVGFSQGDRLIRPAAVVVYND